MWNSINNFRYTEEEIKKIADVLKENEVKIEHCHDCGVSIGMEHDVNCDVSKCSECGGQRFSCGCEEGNGGKWDGCWPGTMECYEKGYLCCWDNSEVWQADLNKLSLMKH